MLYAFCLRTHSDVRIIRHVRIFLAYAFYSADVRILCYVRIYDVCHSATYVLFCRTYATDVRIYRRPPFRGVRILEMESGLHSQDQDSGLTLDLMKKIPLAPSGLQLAPKIDH